MNTVVFLNRCPAEEYQPLLQILIMDQNIWPATAPARFCIMSVSKDVDSIGSFYMIREMPIDPHKKKEEYAAKESRMVQKGHHHGHAAGSIRIRIANIKYPVYQECRGNTRQRPDQ